MVLSRFVAYPSGFSLDVTVVPPDNTPLPNMQAGVQKGREKEAVDQGWRFGIGMADGSKVTVDGYRPSAGAHKMNFRELADTPTPPEPIILPRGSSGGHNRWDVSYWVTPLPTPGPLQIAVQWEEAGLKETVYTMDAQVILDAAATSTPVW